MAIAGGAKVEQDDKGPPQAQNRGTRDSGAAPVLAWIAPTLWFGYLRMHSVAAVATLGLVVLLVAGELVTTAVIESSAGVRQWLILQFGTTSLSPFWFVVISWLLACGVGGPRWRRRWEPDGAPSVFWGLFWGAVTVFAGFATFFGLAMLYALT